MKHIRQISYATALRATADIIGSDDEDRLAFEFKRFLTEQPAVAAFIEWWFEDQGPEAIREALVAAALAYRLLSADAEIQELEELAQC